MWKIKNTQNLDRVLINIPEEADNVDLMFKKLDDPKDSLERMTSFCTIPSKESMKNLHFFHGKCKDSIYNKMKEVIEKLDEGLKDPEYRQGWIANIAMASFQSLIKNEMNTLS